MFRFNGFTQKANDAINLAIAQASALGHGYIGSEHLLLGLLSAEGSAAAVALNSRGIYSQDVAAILVRISGKSKQTVLKQDDLTPCCKRIFETAVDISKEYGCHTVGSEHLLLAILKEKNSAAVMLLKELNTDITSLYKAMCEVSGAMTNINERAVKTNSTKTKTQPKTQMLDRYSRDLTQLAKERKLDPVIAREYEINRVIRILCRRSKNNPCLIGEAGVGKTAVAEGIAQKIIAGDVPQDLENKRLVALDLTLVLAGTKYRGDFEERIKGILAEVIAAKNVILFIDEIHNMMGIGAAEGAIDAANIIKPQLARGEIQLIGATTFDEYRKHIEKDAALERRFQSVVIKEPTETQAVEILKGIREKYEKHHKITIPDDVLEAAVKLSARYITDRYLPDKAIDLIDEAAADLKLKSIYSYNDEVERIVSLKKQKDDAISVCDFELAAKLSRLEKDEYNSSKQHLKGNKEFILKPSDISLLVSQITGIELSVLNSTEKRQLLDLEEKLSERIIGQNEAVKCIAKTIRRGRVGLRDPNRPMGSFLFLGPTGVGKTELCRALSATLFGKEDAMIRLDMSEYMEKQAVSKLIGSPPGYVGYDDGGQLTELIRRKPYSIILFDEVEKAHPDVLHILLQLLEDGRLTDAKGKTCSFKNSIVIMTSNIGAAKITDRTSLGFSLGDENKNKTIKHEVIGELKKVFKPEMINRIDEIVVFNALSENELYHISDKLLQSVAERVMTAGICCEFDDSVKRYIAKQGSDKDYGARPLRRKIQSFIEDELAQQLLNGGIKEGDSIICRMKNDKLSIDKKLITIAE